MMKKKWVSSFDDFRVNTTARMLENIDARVELHQDLKSEDLVNLIGEIDNNVSLETLYEQVSFVVEKIKQQ